jgi:hypothetical protein
MIANVVVLGSNTNKQQPLLMPHAVANAEYYEEVVVILM